MDDMQITTTKKTAEECGYALMGCRNSLSARCAADGVDPMLKQMLNEQKEIISEIITAFAQADIVSDQVDLDATKRGFPVVRYIPPDAQRNGEYAVVDGPIASLALKVIEAGGTFTIEKLSTSVQSLCCEAVVTVDGETDVDDIVCMITSDAETIEQTWSSVVTVAALKLGVDT